MLKTHRITKKFTKERDLECPYITFYHSGTADVRSELSDNTDDPIDGIAELWFESEGTQRQAYTTPEYEAVVKDEPNLFEMSNHYVHPVMTEKIIKLK
jgi:EthD domain